MIFFTKISHYDVIMVQNEPATNSQFCTEFVRDLTLKRPGWRDSAPSWFFLNNFLNSAIS